MRTRGEAGFTLAETLVGIFLFSMLSAGFYSVMLTGVRSSDTTEAVVRISDEARLGFNRMVRDVREATRITAIRLGPDPNASFTVHVDFDGDGETVSDPGEVETFEYDEEQRQILLNSEILMTGVEPFGAIPIFNFSSNRLEYDWSSPCAPSWPIVSCPPDGVAHWQEIDRKPASITQGGNNNRIPDGPELPYLSSISFAMTIANADQATEFFTEAQLRNVRIPRT
ncbi:MAG: type II secretion system protein J [Actinomycetota bacterium]